MVGRNLVISPKYVHSFRPSVRGRRQVDPGGSQVLAGNTVLLSLIRSVVVVNMSGRSSPSSEEDPPRKEWNLPPELER